MKAIHRFLLFCSLLAGIFLYGCSQKDSSVGSNLAPGLNEIHPQEKIVYPDTSAFFKRFSTTGSSDYLYVGRVQGYVAHTLLKFNPYSALPDSYAVDSIVIKMHIESVIEPDPYGNPLEIGVSLIDREQTWSEIGVTWDLLDTAMIPDPVASFDIPSDPGDEVCYSFTPYDYDTSLQDSLLRAWEWAGSGGKTLHYNNGVYLKSDKSDEHMIRFCSAEHDSVSRRPQLEMYVKIYETGADPIDSTLLLYAGGDAYIADDPTELDTAFLYLGNAVAYRSILLFNLQGLFPQYGTGVHRAEVVFHADIGNTSELGQITGTYHFAMEDSSWMEDPESAGYLSGTYQSPVYYDSETATLTLELTDMVYNWIRYPESNYGFLVRPSAEYFDLSRTVFYGVKADSLLLRPQMRIVYIENVP